MSKKVRNFYKRVEMKTLNQFKFPKLHNLFNLVRGAKSYDFKVTFFPRKSGNFLTTRVFGKWIINTV